MLLDPTDLLHSAMGHRQVNLVGGRTGLGGPEPQAPEERLRDPVMSAVFLKGVPSPVRESALPAVTDDQPELLERSQVAQGRGWRKLQRGCDEFQRDAAIGRLLSQDGLQSLQLTAS